MSAVSPTRRLRQHHHRDASDQTINDAFEVEEEPRSILAGGGLPQQRRQASSHAPALDSSTRSMAVSVALNDSDSELARFLLSDDVNDGDDGNMTRLASVSAAFYSLALEPLPLRNERVIMIFEGHAIFGALFMGAVWIIYEWGNVNEGDNVYVDRAFECIMAIALSCNIFLALYGAFGWMFSCLIDSSNEDYAFESRRMLSFLQYLLMATATLVQLGLFLGIYKNLSPHLPETAVTLTIAILLKLVGESQFGHHMETCAPLEFWHYPRVMQALSGPPSLFRRKDLKTRARLRAQKLRRRAHCEYDSIRTSDPSFQVGGAVTSERDESSLRVVLREAAAKLGRDDLDVSGYEARLEDDLFDDVTQLRGRSVECLCRYMPLRLAEEVHALVGQLNGLAE